jgi:phosphatidylglycerophosphate synthase
LLAGAGLALVAGLALAARLEPDPHGVGTHEQLGLPPCTFATWIGFRCPSCGMTTSWAWLMQGRVGEALGANVGGTLLALLAIVAGPWLLASAARGAWATRLPSERMFAVAAVVLGLVTAVDWLVRLASR